MPEGNKRLITAEDLYQIEIVSGTRLSPDGQKIVFAQQRVDAKTEKKYANLWVIDTEEKKPHQFTYGNHVDVRPRWSPDGQQIAFLSNREDKEKPPKLYLIPPYGGEAHLLVDIPGAIGDFSWSPDGKKILCMVQKTDAEVLEREKDENKKKLGTPSRHYDRLFYKLDGYGYLPKERWHLWIVDIEKGEAKQITDHAVYDEREIAWAADGKSIAFVSNRTEDPDSYPDYDDLFIMDLDTGEMKKIDAPVGGKGLPSFSPDGKWIAYVAQEGEGLGYKNASLWIAPLDFSNKTTNLTEKADLHVSAWTINDLGEAETINPTWSLDSKKIYFQAVIHGNTYLMSLDIESQQLETLIGESGVVSSYSFDRTQTKMAYFYGRINDPGQIYIRDMATGSVQCLTKINQTLLEQIDLGTIEEVWYKGADGNDLQGWILKPPSFDPAQKYPSIMEIHGGPLTQYGNLFMHEFYYLASKGFVVYFTNPRGGRGYGEAHAGAIHGNWGDADYRDLMAWADYIAQKPYIDTTRMGVTGGSYGGYMTVWIIGHTQRFKAAVTQRCVSNFVSMWGSSDFNWVFQQELNNKMPFEDLKYYWDHSPIAYIGNAKTPTLVIHNEMDHRCPIEQGEQVFVALKRLGIDTEFVRFPEEFHGLSRNGRTDRRILRLSHIARWFEKYLKD